MSLNCLNGLINIIIIALRCVCMCVSQLTTSKSVPNEHVEYIFNNSNCLRVTCATLTEKNAGHKQIKYSRQMSNTDRHNISNRRFVRTHAMCKFFFHSIFLVHWYNFINILTQSRARLVRLIEIQNSHIFFFTSFE